MGGLIHLRILLAILAVSKSIRLTRRLEISRLNCNPDPLRATIREKKGRLMLKNSLRRFAGYNLLQLQSFPRY